MKQALSFIKKLNPFASISTRYLKLIVSLYPGVAAVLLAFFKDPIINSSRLASQYLQQYQGTKDYTLDWLVFLYWALLICWVVCYFTFVTNESDANKKTTDTLKSAIFRAPNPKVFGEYEIFYKQIMAQLNQINSADILKHEINIQKVLQAICELTSSYINHKDSKVIFGANIMLFLPYKLNKKEIEKISVKTAEWIHFKGNKLDTFNGVLYLIPELTYTTSTGTKKANCPSISLPVIKGRDEHEIAILNIPGAPRAAIEGKFLFSNVKNIEAYRHLGDSECENAENYWKNILPEVNSIFSFGIPYDWGDPEITDAIAVLNIDSTQTDILGTEIEYHTTYISLIYPILCQLAPHLKDYYTAYLTKI